MHLPSRQASCEFSEPAAILLDVVTKLEKHYGIGVLQLS
uniref:Uncharacterized protein n=1 Tax=Anguilla anguilla TaxID=7936 RepID=A0A0E9U7Q4_ANGAN